MYSSWSQATGIPLLGQFSSLTRSLHLFLLGLAFVWKASCLFLAGWGQWCWSSTAPRGGSSTFPTADRWLCTCVTQKSGGERQARHFSESISWLWAEEARASTGTSNTALLPREAVVRLPVLESHWVFILHEQGVLQKQIKTGRKLIDRKKFYLRSFRELFGLPWSTRFLYTSDR